MSWGEFVTLLGGLNEKTPLGRIVSVRSEEDPEALKHFTSQQRRIRSAWREKKAKKVSEQEYNLAMEGFKEMFKSLAGGG